jgi:phosphate transport system protein
VSPHLRREIERLKKGILSLSALVEESVERAARSIVERDLELANEVIEGDREIDEMEVSMEEDCLKALALHQPVAIDLRFIISVLKINNDLERMGDLAVNVAERTEKIVEGGGVEIPFDLEEMAQKTRRMVSDALDSLVQMDSGLAREVCRNDDEVDALNAQMFQNIQSAIQQNPSSLQGYVQLMSAGRQLERIADHATNISEDVIYMIEGDIVRHTSLTKSSS